MLEPDDDEDDDDEEEDPEVDDEADPLLVGRLPNMIVEWNVLSLLSLLARPGFVLFEVKRRTERRRGPLCAFKLRAIDEQ